MTDDVPDETPVTVAPATVATAVLPPDQVPPVVISPRVIVDPAHKGTEPEMGCGVKFTVTIVVTVQPVPIE